MERKKKKVRKRTHNSVSLTDGYPNSALNGMGEVLKVGRKPMSWNRGTVARFDSLLGYSESDI